MGQSPGLPLDPPQPEEANAVRVLIEAALDAHRTGRIADPWTLEPTYIRPSAAQEKAEGLAGAGAGPPP